MGFVLLAAALLLVVSLYLVSEHVKNKALYEQLGVLRGSLLNATMQGGGVASLSTSTSSFRQQRLQQRPLPQDQHLHQEPWRPEQVSVINVDPGSYDEVREKLGKNPLHAFLASSPKASYPPLEDVLYFLHNRPECKNKPIFTTMANVGSPLYWQLIENFVYTMAKYGLSDCTLMICVSDPHCMSLCKENSFPCFDHQHKAEKGGGGGGGGKATAHTMEQIAQLKLTTMPKALLRGVDIFMLDLDVGFLADPMRLVGRFSEPGSASAGLDAIVQQDVVFIMNRSVAGWKQWWTEPMPNIGLFLVRGNKKAHDVFTSAWEDYRHNTPKNIRQNPGKDQNKVVNAMRVGKWRSGFKWGYMANTTAVLIDKVFKFEDMAVELGGEAAVGLLDKRGAVAVHTTCYEQKSKINGLKASNAFWNPKYYDTRRRTLTKKILFTSPRHVLNEVRALVFLAKRTKRTLIIPNVLAPTITDPALLQAEDKRSNKAQRPVFRNQTLWPGFRVLYLKTKSGGKNGEPLVDVDVAEPSFYWRLRRDYASPSRPVPRPHVLSLPAEEASVKAIEAAMLLPQNDAQPRLILHLYTPFSSSSAAAAAAAGAAASPSVVAEAAALAADLNAMIAQQLAWADDSVGKYLDFALEALLDRKMPELDEAEFEPEREEQQRSLARNIVQNTRLCNNILDRMRGNRSCMDKCD